MVPALTPFTHALEMGHSDLGLGSLDPLTTAAGDDNPTYSSGCTLLVLAMAALELHNEPNSTHFDTSFACSFLAFLFWAPLLC